MAKFQNKKYVFIVLGLIIALLIINIIPGFINNLGNFVFKITGPISGFFIKIGDTFSCFFGTLFSIRDLANENVSLRIKNMELESEISSLKEIKRQNLVLEQGLQALSEIGEIKQIASIIWKENDWLLINKGENSGIEKNMAVVSKQGSLIGKIFEVSKDFSKVMLIVNKESIVAALLEDKRSEGLIRKEKQENLFMDFIPKSETLEINERIITSGMDNIYPKGILIGKIETIDFSQNQLFQRITVIPIVNFSKLEEVFIIK